MRTSRSQVYETYNCSGCVFLIRDHYSCSKREEIREEVKFVIARTTGERVKKFPET